jgi:glycosyltransferase involved in cell wall biosynthesis
MPALPQLETSIPLRKVWDRWRRKIDYVALHTAIRDELVADGVKQERIRLIPNGVEPPVEIAEPGTGGYVLYVGNFTQGQNHKGFDVLCKAWAQVCLENPKANLVMAGQGDTTPWSQMFEQLGVIQQVEFVGYVQPLDELYRGAALFVLPSRHEGMSNALLEAQAWGLPAVVSAIPGNSLVVDGGISGVVVPVGDHLAFAEAILFLLADAQKRKAMGTSARARINEHFTIDRVATNYTALYADLLQ